MNNPLANAVPQSIFAVGGGGGGGLVSQGILANSNGTTGASMERSYRSNRDKTLFRAMLEVTKVANGFLVKIATHEGELAETFIAETPEQVNDIILASITKFRLEQA